MAFELPQLPYAYDALEPHIDARTMEIHHGKHHAGYTAKLNAAIDGTNMAGKSIEDLCAQDSAMAPSTTAAATSTTTSSGPACPPMVAALRRVTSRPPSMPPSAATTDSRTPSRCGGDALRQRLGLVVRQGRRAGGLLHGQPGQPADAGSRLRWRPSSASTFGSTPTT